MGSRIPAPPAWFTRLCVVDRPDLSAPLPLTLAGARWLSASDGTAATALRGGSTEPVPFERKRIAALLAQVFGRRGLSCRVATWPQIESFLAGVSASEYEINRGLAASGVTINRSLLKRFLGPLQAESVKVFTGEELDPVHFVTKDWIVVVMPMRCQLAELLPSARLFDDDGAVALQRRALSSGALGAPHRGGTTPSEEVGLRATRKRKTGGR